MKTTKKMMVSALLIMAVLSVGITPIFAAPDFSRGAEKAQQAQRSNIIQQMSQQGNIFRNRIQERLQALSAPIDISDLDDSAIDDVFAQVEAANAIEDDGETVAIWYLNARGHAEATITDANSLNAASPVGVQLLAEKVKTTDYGKLYKVLWGRINHKGEKVEVEGYAVLDTDGVFYLKLTGEDISFKTIGRIRPAGVGVNVAMKGYMTHDAQDYSVQMHGRAIPLRGGLLRNRLQGHPQKEDVENDPVMQGGVTPNADNA